MSTDAKLLDLLIQIAARLDVIENVIGANVQKDVAPTPAPVEEQEPECPPGFKWDQAIQRCVEAQPAPAMEKATPAKLIKERKRRITQSL